MSNACDYKIVLLGSECVGKTSLVLRFVNLTFNNKTFNTIGAAFCAKRMISNEQEYTLGIWDTAGSERYAALASNYYRGAHAAILCYEPSNTHSWTRLKYWLMELRNVEEDCKVYICATKKDLLDQGVTSREVPLETAMLYARNGPDTYFETSSKTGENIDELFQKIVDDLSTDPKVIEASKRQKGIRVEQEELVKTLSMKRRNQYCLC